MSYCVNCGVELETSLKKCPLCNTPVINPNELQNAKEAASPYPKEKGEVEAVKRKDWAILVSVVCGATAITCGLLNFLVFNKNQWSLLVIGVCMFLWVCAVPTMLYPKFSVYASLFLDGVALAMYLFMMTYVTHSDRWFLILALPIVFLIMAVAELFAFLYRKVAHSFLSTAIYLFGAISVICVGVELLIDNFLGNALALSWSAIVLAVCIIIELMLITIISSRRFRGAIRKRFHF